MAGKNTVDQIVLGMDFIQDYELTLSSCSEIQNDKIKIALLEKLLMNPRYSKRRLREYAFEEYTHMTSLYEQSAWDLIENCVMFDSSRRLTAQQCLKHEFLSKYSTCSESLTLLKVSKLDSDEPANADVRIDLKEMTTI